MSRRAARELVLHLIFQNDYLGTPGESLFTDEVNERRFAELAAEYELYAALPEKSQMKYIKQACLGVAQNRAELDGFITKYSVGWNLARISRVSRCILRLCMYEIKYMGIPLKASVNEALELAKLYDGPEAAQFINGIIGSFVKEQNEAVEEKNDDA